MTDTMTRPTPAAGRPRRGPSGRTVLLIAAAVVLALLAAAVVWTVATRYALWAGDWLRHGDRPAHVVQSDRGGLTAATVDLVSGATTVTVRAADLGDRLVRVSTPDGSGLVPAVVRTGSLVQVHRHDNGAGGPAAVVIDLARGVAWDVRLTAGATADTLDLRGASVRSVTFVG